MAEDVSDALRQDMLATFELKQVMDPKITALKKKIREGKATQNDVAAYSDRLGELVRATMHDVITPEALPNETLYHNILEKTVGVLLKNAHMDVNKKAIEAQKAIDKANGIGMSAVEAPYPQKRVDDLLYKAGKPGTSYEDAMKTLDAPVETLTRAFHDDHIKKNADVRFHAGLSPKIVRTASFKCCEWCASLAGVYNYEDVKNTGNDVWRRHENCKCTVEYVCDGKKTEVWGSKHYEADEETLQQRESYRTETKKTETAAVKSPEPDQKALQARAEYNTTGDTSPETLQLRSEYGLANGGESGIIKSTKGTAAFSKIAKKRLLQHERIISGNIFETAIVYDSQGKMLFQRKGDGKSVSGFTRDELKLMRGCVLTHNHPNRTCFSETDINTFRLRGLAEIRACNPDGAYVLRRIKTWPRSLSSKKKLETTYREIEDRVASKYLDIAAQEGRHFLYYLRAIDEETMAEFAKEYGLEFFWEQKEE